MIDRGTRAFGTGQVRGQAVVVTAVDQQGHLAIQQVGQIGDSVLHAIHRKRDVTAIEVAAVQHMFADGIDDRVVVGAIEFILNRGAEEWQGISQNANHMRRTADRVTILQAFAVAFQQLARQVFAHPRSDLLHAGVRLDGEQHFIEVMRIAIHCERRHRRDARAQLGQVGSTIIG